MVNWTSVRVGHATRNTDICLIICSSIYSFIFILQNANEHQDVRLGSLILISLPGLFRDGLSLESIRRDFWRIRIRVYDSFLIADDYVFCIIIKNHSKERTRRIFRSRSKKIRLSFTVLFFKIPSTRFISSLNVNPYGPNVPLWQKLIAS